MSFKKNGKNVRYDNLKMSTESKDRILAECLKVLDEEYENNSGEAEKASEFELKRKEKQEKESKYEDAFKKFVVASVSVAATIAIIAGAVNFNKMQNETKNAKSTESTKIKEISSEYETDSDTEEVITETETKKKKKKNNDKETSGNGVVDDTTKETEKKTSKSSEFENASSPARWIDGKLQAISKNAYYSGNSLREGYETKTFSNSNEKTYDITGKDFVELTAEQDINNYAVKSSSNVVYFICGEKAYQVVLDCVFEHKNYGEFIASQEGYAQEYDYCFKTDEGVNYYYNESEDMYYLIDEETGEKRPVFDEISFADTEVSSLKYDKARKNVRFSCSKMGNHQGDDDIPGLRAYRMPCFNKDGDLVKEISIVEDRDGSNRYYNVINDIDNGYMYYVSTDNKLYRISNVDFRRLDNIYSDSIFGKITGGYPSLFNSNTTQFDKVDPYLCMVRSIISVDNDAEFTLLAENVRYIRTEDNEYLSSANINGKIKVVPTKESATIIEEDGNVTY